MTLRKLGFKDDEVSTCVAWPDGRLGVRAEIEGKEAVMLIATSVRLDLSLIASYVHSRGFPIVRSNDSFSVCSLSEFRALGRSRPHDTAVLFGEPESGYSSSFAGSIGVGFLHDSIVGLDAGWPAIGVSTRAELSNGLAEPVCRIPLVGDAGDGPPITCSVRDVEAPNAQPAFLISSGGDRSTIALSYFRAHRSGRGLKQVERAARKGIPFEVELDLPNGVRIPLNVRIDQVAPTYAVDVGVDHLDGSLGIDFLRRWLQVFDFPSRELLLFDYQIDD
jgi:hypothetical protein